jgi:excisionase family DNA binding protein
MTTREAAVCLRLKERRVYDRVRRGAIPCTRVTGKWLFPRALIDRRLLEWTEGWASPAREPSPPVITGSHDPLFEWAVQASQSGLALLMAGSLEGLARVSAGSALAWGVHVAGPEGADNVTAAERAGADADAMMIEWAPPAPGADARTG